MNCSSRTPVAAIGRDVVTDPVRRVAGDQRVATEAVAIEEAGARQAEPGIERPVEVLAEAVGLDPERLHQCMHDGGEVCRGGLQRLAPAVADQPALADGELVAARVSAEVIVIVQHEDARVGTVALAVEPRCSQPADTPADDDAVELVVDRQAADAVLAMIERHAVRGLERAVVLAAQPGEGRRVRVQRPPPGPTALRAQDPRRS